MSMDRYSEPFNISNAKLSKLLPAPQPRYNRQIRYYRYNILFSLATAFARRSTLRR